MNAINITKEPATSQSVTSSPIAAQKTQAENQNNRPRNIGTQIRAMVDRTIKRNIKGLSYLTSSKPDVGLTPKDVLIERGTMRLYHYHPMADEVYRTPILLVMATTNKSYIFDLAPGQSMVEYLLKAGYDVFVLDWEDPKPEERGLTLADYTQDFIPSCISRIAQETGEPDVSIIGYCMGGVLSLIYAATHADGPLRNLICMTTPINWKEMGLFHAWTDERHFDVDHLVRHIGAMCQATCCSPLLTCCAQQTVPQAASNCGTICGTISSWRRTACSIVGRRKPFHWRANIIGRPRKI